MNKSNRIFRFDFSGDEPKILPMPAQESKPTQKKSKNTVSPEKREAMNRGKEQKKETLSPREKRFCELYVETCNGAQSVMRAGYNTANNNSASVQANGLLRLPKIQREITRISESKSTIATAQEVMERLSAMARGEEKDQFGLEISADTRLKALVELAKRTIDVENKAKAAQTGENAITIKLDWQTKDNIQ